MTTYINQDLMVALVAEFSDHVTWQPWSGSPLDHPRCAGADCDGGLRDAEDSLVLLRYLHYGDLVEQPVGEACVRAEIKTLLRTGHRHIHARLLAETNEERGRVV
jgi:hypothetical protein